MFVFYVAMCIQLIYREKEMEKNIWDGRIEGKIIVELCSFVEKEKTMHEIKNKKKRRL